MSSPRPLEQRFWEKVKRGADDACWPWTGCINAESGYGRIRLSRQRRTEFAHRVSFRLAYGAIPDGKLVCHKCDNPPCCNPRHLYAGTGTDNMLDRVRHGRQAGGARSGGAHHMAKLTQDRVDEIRRRLAAGETGKALSLEFGVARSQISRIKLGQSWSKAA